MMKTTARILLVNALYGVIGFLLYRARLRGQTHGAFLDSDALVFLVPAVLAIALNGVIMWSAFPNRIRSWGRVPLTIACAFALTFVAFWGYMLFGLNLYGE